MSFWSHLLAGFRRGPRRPLSQYQPLRQDQEETPLGFEALDLREVNAVNRRNAALERISTPFSNISGARVNDRPVTQMPDDETYAARYHRAYNRKGSPQDDGCKDTD